MWIILNFNNEDYSILYKLFIYKMPKTSYDNLKILLNKVSNGTVYFIKLIYTGT